MASIGTGNLARASARRPWLVVALWVLLLVAGGALAGTYLASGLTNEQAITNNPESIQADELIRASGIPGRDVRQPVTEVFILRSKDYTVDSPQFQAKAKQLVQDMTARTTEVRSIVGPVGDTKNPMVQGLISKDRRTAIFPATLQGDVVEAAEHVIPLLEYQEANTNKDGFELYLYGYASVNETFTRVSEEDLPKAEQRALPVSLIVLLLVFGAVIAAFVPLILAAVAIAVTMGVVALIGQVWQLSFFVTNMIFMIGLAVGIDYCLFIIERFREERRHGAEKIDAIAVAGDTASRAVLFSGITVVIALAGMFIVPSNIFKSLATGAIVVVIVALAVTLTLLPAVLSLLGDWVNRPRIPFFSNRHDGDDNSGFWADAARTVMGHPWISLILSTSFLVALSIPYFGIHLGISGADSLPETTQVWTANEIIAAEFSQGQAFPSEIVVTAPNVRAPEVLAGIQRIEDKLRADQSGRFTNVNTTFNERNDLAIVSVAIRGDYAADEAINAVREFRGTIVPEALAGTGARALVGGGSALTLDFFNVVEQYTPLVFAFVLTLSFLLLLMVFRSLIVPFKAIVMNLLSVGASYGLLVLVFQEGVGTDLLGFQRSPVIQAWLPLFMFSILFGLSMDYHVFLLSRVRERFDQTRDNAGSVAFGLRSTANIITGAALIMVTVFGGFALGEMVMFQQIGFGLGVAVLLDATIVRMVLVPAAMELLGDRNWYLPRWLAWLPDLRVEGPASHPAPRPAATAGAPIGGASE